MPDEVVLDSSPWRRYVARIQAQAEANPELFRLQADATDSIIARWDELSPAQRRRYGRLNPLQLTRRQATELLRAHKTQIDVPPRLQDRAPRPRRRSSRRRARAPARPEDPEPDLEVSHDEFVRLIVAWEAEI